MNDKTTDLAAAQRLVPKLRRVLAESSSGMARAALRRRIASRDKHAYDAALDLLIAVGDVVAGPALRGSGTRYKLTDTGYAGVGPASDEETHPEEG